MNTLLANPKHQTLTIRVVFDGAAGSGKTTALYALGDIIGSPAATPADEQAATEWFDWLTYNGGQHEGDSLHVEVVSVPGAPELHDRRDHLLGWGDAIVFVADTSPAAFAASVEAFHQMQAAVGHRDDIPVVVIANKRDAAGAVELDFIRQEFGLSSDDTIIEAIATSSAGIREGFIYAVHAALAHPLTRTESTTAHDLLADMQQSFLAAEPAAGEQVEEETTSTPPLAAVVLSNAQLNPHGLADGAVVIMPAHWRMLVDVANGRSELPMADGTDDAATAFELVSWGLIKGSESVVFSDPDAIDVTEHNNPSDHTADSDIGESPTSDANETTNTEGTKPMPNVHSNPEHQASPSS